MKSFNRDCKLPQVFMRRDQCFISCLRVSRITVCGPEKIRIPVSYCWSTEAGGIQTRLGGEGAIFCLPAAGGVGCVGVRSRHLSDLGPLCCCSPGQVVAPGPGLVAPGPRLVALALGWWPQGLPSRWASQGQLSRAHSAAGNLNPRCMFLFPRYPPFPSFPCLVTSVL